MATDTATARKWLPARTPGRLLAGHSIRRAKIRSSWLDQVSWLRTGQARSVEKLTKLIRSCKNDLQYETRFEMVPGGRIGRFARDSPVYKWINGVRWHTRLYR